MFIFLRENNHCSRSLASFTVSFKFPFWLSFGTEHMLDFPDLLLLPSLASSSLSEDSQTNSMAGFFTIATNIIEEHVFNACLN
ncbi:hypothetical protein BpHYR1_013313 [Brachionus plicatilis]|uniref:Uncharacterized protein n=1 Tax=Brachionus plicatilis TaxID=10195 RepID=A0A3M7QT36_BRAPC|nr:hypothetical protein BpHYR1_013313 [Brachionus plicatilis]